MSRSYFELLDRLKPNLPDPRETARQAPVAVDQAADERELVHQNALVVDTADRTFITVPISAVLAETAQNQDADLLDVESFLTRISGRLVGAEQPNRNKQFWATADLEFGLGSVATGPLNWLHDERHIVGTLTSAELVTPDKVSAGREGQQPGPHIKADSVMWSYLFPSETRIVQHAAASKSLYYSMECVSAKVQCVGEKGCGHEMAFADAVGRTERACAHIRDRAANRRFVNPVFQGAAVIVAPVQPGWKDAHADLLKRAAANEQLSEFTAGDEALAAQILAFIRQPILS